PPKTPDRAYPWLRTRSMPMPMTGSIDRVEVITWVQRRRCWSAEEKARIAVDRPDTRWCSDGFEIGCDNGEKVRIAFTLDCCDREAISWVATTGGISSSDVRDLMVESVERRFGLVNKLPKPIEWLSDNGSPYTAGETRALARDIGLVPCTTPIQSPQSNGMAEAFVKTIKRDRSEEHTSELQSPYDLVCRLLLEKK